MSLKNPYETRFTESLAHKVTARVDTRDYHYLKRLFSAHTGLSDKIISNLYAALVKEIKSYGLDASDPDHQAWHTDHPNHTLPERILAGITFVGVGGPIIGRPSARDDGRAAERIREETQRAPVQRPDAEGKPRQGRGRKARGEKKTK